MRFTLYVKRAIAPGVHANCILDCREAPSALVALHSYGNFMYLRPVDPAGMYAEGASWRNERVSAIADNCSAVIR